MSKGLIRIVLGLILGLDLIFTVTMIISAMTTHLPEQYASSNQVSCLIGGLSQVGFMLLGFFLAFLCGLIAMTISKKTAK